MIRFFFRRIRYSLLVLWGVVTLVFFMFQVLPGDPARLTMASVPILPLSKQFVKNSIWISLSLPATAFT